jgi:acetyl-CoA C-acetyltransferase
MTSVSGEDRTPVLVGVGQSTQRDADPAAARSPLDLLVEVARLAADDAGGGARLLSALDRLAVVGLLSWRYPNLPAALAARLGARPADAFTTHAGGNTPQWLVNESARRIAAGDARIALVAGAEAIATRSRARKAGVKLEWPDGAGGAAVVRGDPRLGSSDHEVAHGLMLPPVIYPLFENAYRAHRGRGLAAHREALGQLMSRFSQVAEQNPHAWFPKRRSAEEIATPGPDNRMIAFPYPKRMNAILEVDQAAAVLVTSVEAARRLGIPEDRWVYWWGGSEAIEEPWFVSERALHHDAPAYRAAARAAFDEARIAPADVARFDLYSCFPCAVEIARDALGIGEDDPRPLTVTGGLAYAGGPGNNYSTHAIAAMVEALRAARGEIGYVSALGWYLTKHAAGIYGSMRREDWTGEAGDGAVELPPSAPVPPLARAAEGGGTIATYTVVYDRAGAPERGIVLGRLDDGRLFLANTPPDRALLESLTEREAVGLRGTVAHADGRNVFTPS